MEVVLKLIAGEVNPVQLTLARFSIGFVFLAPVAVYTLKKRSKRLDRKSVAYFALLGLIGIAICMPIYQMSVSYTHLDVYKRQLQGLGLGPLFRGQLALRQQGGVQQQIGDGGLGLVGHVGDQSRDLALFLRQIPGGGGGAVEEPGRCV